MLYGTLHILDSTWVSISCEYLNIPIFLCWIVSTPFHSENMWTCPLQGHEHIPFLGSWTQRALAVTCFHSEFFLNKLNPNLRNFRCHVSCVNASRLVRLVRSVRRFAKFDPDYGWKQGTQSSTGDSNMSKWPKIWCLCANFCVQNSLGWDVNNPCLEICTPLVLKHGLLEKKTFTLW